MDALLLQMVGVFLEFFFDFVSLFVQVSELGGSLTVVQGRVVGDEGELK